MVLERDERKRGRPKKDEARSLKYVTDADIEIDQSSVSKERQKLGRFVLASNDSNLDSETMLKYYKDSRW